MQKGTHKMYIERINGSIKYNKGYIQYNNKGQICLPVTTRCILLLADFSFPRWPGLGPIITLSRASFSKNLKSSSDLKHGKDNGYHGD